MKKHFVHNPSSIPSKTVHRSQPIAIVYCKGLSEKLQRIFREHGSNIDHLLWNTIRQYLVHPKDKVDKINKCGNILPKHLGVL